MPFVITNLTLTLFKAIVKPFVGYELLQKVVLHPTTLDLEKFHKEHIPKSHLPSDYGGQLKSVAELHEQTRQTFKKLRDYFLYEEMQTNFHFDEYAEEIFEKQKV